MGAAQCACTLDSRERQPEPNTHPDTNARPYGHTYTHTDSNSPTRRRRLMRSGMESKPCLLQHFHHHLQWRKHCEQERLELYCAILEPGSGSDDCRPRRPGRIRRSVVYRRCLHRRRADTYSNSHSYSQADSYTNSASAGQRDLRCV